MPGCKFPEHHESGGGGGGLVALVAAIVAASVLASARPEVIAALLAVLLVTGVLVSGGARAAAVAVAAGIVVAGGLYLWAHPWWLAIPLALAVARAARTAPRSWAACRHYPRAIWAGFRWRFLTRNLQLSYRDRHRRRLLRLRAPGTTAIREPDNRREFTKVRWPRAVIRPDAYGLVATVKTIPRVGRAELEDAAPHIANAWRCQRVQVRQRKPGRLVVRGLVRDPLTEALPQASVVPAAPSGADLWRPYLGRDEWGTDRHIDLRGLTGITIGGLPGYGKTRAVLGLLAALAASPAVQFAFIDGKGSVDYDDWAARAWLSVGDDLPGAVGALEDIHALMRRRFAQVREVTGHTNAWQAGPLDRFPLQVTVIDECHGFFDLEAVRGDKQAEAQVRRARALTGQLVKKGRSVLMLTVLITQKQTSDAIPTAIRDICGLGLSFATRTVDAAVAALGEAIRGYRSVCPTTLQARPDYVGVCTASLPTGADPFVRLRVPDLTEEAAAGRAAATAHLRRDPAVLGYQKLVTPPLALVPEEAA